MNFYGHPIDSDNDIKRLFIFLSLYYQLFLEPIHRPAQSFEIQNWGAHLNEMPCMT